MGDSLIAPTKSVKKCLAFCPINLTQHVRGEQFNVQAGCEVPAAEGFPLHDQQATSSKVDGIEYVTLISSVSEIDARSTLEGVR